MLRMAEKPSKDLYFIICEPVNAVKIGQAKDCDSRLTSLQVACPLPLKLLAVFPQMSPLESTCRKRLAKDRLHGEWFRFSASVEYIISDLHKSIEAGKKLFSKIKT